MGYLVAAIAWSRNARDECSVFTLDCPNREVAEATADTMANDTDRPDTLAVWLLVLDKDGLESPVGRYLGDKRGVC